MEVNEGEFFKCKSSAGAVPNTIKSKSRNLSANDLGHKMEVGKKRGVYVVKWVDPKHAEGTEDKQSNPKSKAQPTPQPQTQKLLTSAPAPSKIFTYTRLLGTADPVVRFIKRKPKKPPSEKLPQQSSKISSTKPSKLDMPKNIEENKKLKKIRSNAHKLQRKDSETDTIFKSKKEVASVSPSTSNIAQNKSYEATWSDIFPKESNLGNTHLLQQYVCNYEQTVVETNNGELDEKPAKEVSKEEPIYDFFVDLLESVYDDDVAANPEILSKSPDITFEIYDQVAQKLEKQEQSSRHYTIKRDIAYDQSRQLADYYNKSRLIPLPDQRKKKRNKIYKPAFSKGNPIKNNLLNLLKQQLSLDFNTYQDPETMHEALLNIAKNKRKRKQIYFEEDVYSEDKLCSLKRRNVISTRTRQRKHLKPINTFINSNTAKYRTGSDISKISESSYSLEVQGFDYDERDILEPDTDFSGLDINMELAVNRVNSVRPIPDFNEVITTVTKHWAF